MSSTLEKIKSDVDKLVEKGRTVELAFHKAHNREQLEALLKEEHGKDLGKYMATIPRFDEVYQAWYSEAKAVVKLLLPDRLDDFVRHYEKPKGRKDINFENYRLEDSLQGLHITKGWEKEKIVGPDAGEPHLRQQLLILKATVARFESSLFEVRQLVQADLFDGELAAAKELAKNKFLRAAGALAGVTLERHLSEVCSNHNLKITKKAPGIADLNELLKSNDLVSVSDWRFIQHLADIRNVCDHDKKIEPTADQVSSLISGVEKITKTLF